MGKQWKQCQTLFFWGSKITADGDCSHEIKRRSLLGRKVMINLDSISKSRDITLPTKVHEIKRQFLLGRKVMTDLDSILKSRDITLPTKVRLVKAMVFPVVMYGCESWTVKKAESRRIDAFELWCWRKLLRVPWTARRSSPF